MIIEYTKWFTMNLDRQHLRDGIVEQIFKNNLLPDYIISTDDDSLKDVDILNKVHQILSHHTFQEFCSIIKLNKLGIRSMDQLGIEDYQAGLMLAGIKVNSSEVIFKFQFKPKSKCETVFGDQVILNLIFNIMGDQVQFHSMNFESMPQDPTQQNQNQPNGKNQNRVSSQG